MGRERYDGRWGAVPCGRSSQLFVSMQPSELFSPRFCRVRFPVTSLPDSHSLQFQKPIKPVNRGEGNCFSSCTIPSRITAISTPTLF
jgi:hypothetical protein